jgi:hypothetical protein
MSEDFRRKKLKEDEKPLWEQMGRDTKKSFPKYDWSSLKSKISGEKAAAEVATEEIEELKKKKNGI